MSSSPSATFSILGASDFTGVALPTCELPKHRLVIALDFGTTFSGVAYAYDIPGNEAEVVCIKDWPGLDGLRQPKIPTLIMYDETEPEKFKWGGLVEWSDPAVYGVKLMLDRRQSRLAYLPQSSFLEDGRNLSKAPVEIVADFLGNVYKHALSVIKSEGHGDFVDHCEKDFVLSVPAVWSDKAKDQTLKAAKAAGIHPVTLIKEPEAAALYTLTTRKHTMKKHDAFVVCDAGGGTVDLITYEIEETEPHLKLLEVVPGKGGMFGSLGLNERFEEKVRNLVGDDEFSRLKEPYNKGVDAWSAALKEFDTQIKTTFKGDPDNIHFVHFRRAQLQPNEAKGLSNNCWEMTGQDLHDIFEPIIKDILQLVDDQIQSALAKRGDRGVQAIFLVGGFGSSCYLRKRLEETYEGQGVKVYQPHDAWEAIVKGAVLSRLADQATVVSTKAVRHYGVGHLSNCDVEIDYDQHKEFFPYDGQLKVQRMAWFIHIGDNLKRDQTIKLNRCKVLESDYTSSDLVFYETLYFSEAIQAPKHPGLDVRTCCSLKSDLRSTKKKDLARFTGVDGRIYYRLNYKLVLCTATANLKFSLEYKGREVGSVEANYK